MLSFKLMKNFDLNYEIKIKKKQLKSLNENFHLIKNCFSEESYWEENCIPLCQKYSLTSLSETFFGEFEFYSSYLK